MILFVISTIVIIVALVWWEDWRITKSADYQDKVKQLNEYIQNRPK